MTPTACSRTFSRHHLWLLRFSSPRYLFKGPVSLKETVFGYFDLRITQYAAALLKTIQPIVHQAYIKEGYKNLSEETKRKK